MQRKALGRGLEALLSDRVEDGRWIEEIPIDAIVPNPDQPRRLSPDPQGLDGLVESIRSRGVLQPVIVQRRSEGSYELVAGERRWRAARLAGLSTVPAVVREVSSADRLEVALIENLQREDLNPIEEAHAYQRLSEEFGLSQEEISRRVGKDRSSVANQVRLLKLSPEIQAEVVAGRLTMGHARALLGLKSAEEQKGLCGKILRQGLSVRQTEEAVVRARKPEERKRGAQKDVHLQAVAEQLSRALMTRVQIRGTAERGALVISYYSLDDLQAFADILSKAKRADRR